MWSKNEWAQHLQNLTTASIHAPRESTNQGPVIRRAAAEMGFKVFELGGEKLQSKEALLDGLAAAMAFPGYFGRNWDALLDCMRDLSWCPSPGYVLFLDHAEELLGDAPEAFMTFVEIASQAGDDWRSKG